ncbi:MAG TPA: hypothetical protein VEL76_22425 [Gemmataceae bacterium]|nr:hypothetical protein [Gemmataceae bacterium]
MLYKFARSLQFIGLIVPLVAISGNVAERLPLKDSLILSGIGMGIFFLGWLIQQGARPE